MTESGKNKGSEARGRLCSYVQSLMESEGISGFTVIACETGKPSHRFHYVGAGCVDSGAKNTIISMMKECGTHIIIATESGIVLGNRSESRNG